MAISINFFCYNNNYLTQRVQGCLENSFRFMYACMQLYTYVYVFACLGLYIPVYICIIVCTYIYVCIMCVRTYVYTLCTYNVLL